MEGSSRVTADVLSQFFFYHFTVWEKVRRLRVGDEVEIPFTIRRKQAWWVASVSEPLQHYQRQVDERS
jgi:hypothetical protein